MNYEISVREKFKMAESKNPKKHHIGGEVKVSDH